MREEMEQRIKQSEAQQTELANRHKMEFQELIQRLPLTESEQHTRTNRITTLESLAKRQSQHLALVETEQINTSTRTTALESQPKKIEDVQVEDKLNNITQGLKKKKQKPTKTGRPCSCDAWSYWNPKSKSKNRR
jgi:hypothetical protein